MTKEQALDKLKDVAEHEKKFMIAAKQSYDETGTDDSWQDWQAYKRVYNTYKKVILIVNEIE